MFVPLFSEKKEEEELVSSSLSLQFLAVGPRLSPSGLGDVTPGRDTRWKQDFIAAISATMNTKIQTKVIQMHGENLQKSPTVLTCAVSMCMSYLRW